MVVKDFNKIDMEKVLFLEDSYEMTRVITEGVATHSRCNTLDGVWVSANIKITTTTLKDGIKEVTDHSMIELSFLLDKNANRKLLHRVDTLSHGVI
jgi:hypothetical protein